jgi:hypothetical protein
MNDAPPDLTTLAFLIFTHAKRLDGAAHLIGLQTSKNPNFIVPYVVMASFVFELYLKCLVVLDTNKRPPNIHDYVKLFELLSDSSKAKVKEVYDNNPSPALEMVRTGKFPKELNPEHVAFLKAKDFSFEATLSRAKNAFENFRYIYEEWHDPQDDPKFEFSVNSIVQGVIEAIKAQRPAWYEQDPPRSWR